MRSLAFTALLLTGCATTWTHSTKDEQAFQADRYECEKDSAPVTDAWQRISMQDRCMRVKGWTPKQ